MSQHVECYAGSTYPEQPRGFVWEGQHFEVQAILRRRQEPDGIGFLVRCDPDKRCFDLFYSTVENQWRITPK
jgi:hypothetical protein